MDALESLEDVKSKWRADLISGLYSYQITS